ncbi:MAG: SOS response-associated peptidase [Acidiferrobacterales bacterium]
MNVHDHEGVQELLQYFGLTLAPERFTARHNIAPGALVFGAFSADGPQLAEMEWGIVPPWAKPGNFSRPLINARAETIWDKPSFRKLVKERRTILPINGFYEWQRSGGNKIPYYFDASSAGAIALGGIYQISTDGVLQCCVVTTGANELMQPIHDRMPVVVPAEAMGDWLNSEDRNIVDQLMKPAEEGVLKKIRVSRYVNNARNEGEKCTEPEAER